MLPRTSRPLALGVSAALATAGLLLATPDAASAATQPGTAFGGYAYGSTVKVGTVSAGQSSVSSLCTTSAPSTSSNTAATVDLGALGTIGAVDTSVKSSDVDGTISSTATTQTAQTALLGGLVTADALTTTSSVSYTKDGGYTTSGSTSIDGLKIAGIAQSAKPGVNSKINIPLVGSVTLNAQAKSTSAGLTRMVTTGLRIDLLSTSRYGAGTIVIGSSDATLHTPTTYRPYGGAFATQVDVAGVVKSGKSSLVNLPCGGSGGKVLYNQVTASVPGVVSLATVSDSAVSTDDGVTTTAILKSQITGINILNGAVTADAITARAQASRKAGKLFTTSNGSSIAGLKINGEPVTVDFAENSSIDVAGVGSLTFRKVTKYSTGIDVTALVLTLNTEQAGLPAGTTIQVAGGIARVAP